MRSGSSFLGQIFNHHPKVLYMYEPFYVLKSTTLAYSSFYESSALRLLSDIFSCSLENQGEFLNFLTNLPHRRFSSRALTLPFCSFNQTNYKTGKKKYICKPLDPIFTSRICRSRRYRVVKLLTHRIPNFTVNFFKPLIYSLNVKILHLVRDPRAVVASMETVGWVQSYTKPAKLPSLSGFKYRVKRFCFAMIDTIKFILEAEEALPGRYKLLRYEDLVGDVTKISDDVMSFAGFRHSDDVTRWIQKSTNLKDLDMRTNDYHYTTDRGNISRLVDSWRFKLNDEQIFLVEKYCKHVMMLLNYPAVFS